MKKSETSEVPLFSHFMRQYDVVYKLDYYYKVR